MTPGFVEAVFMAAVFAVGVAFGAASSAVLKRRWATAPPEPQQVSRAAITAPEPVVLGWVNCGCMGDAAVPTAYQVVSVIRAVEWDGRRSAQHFTALRCVSCGRCYLMEEIDGMARKAKGREPGGSEGRI